VHSQQETNSAALSPTSRCRYWRDVAVDALLALAAAREHLGLIDEDLVYLIARERHAFYTKLGGTSLSLAMFRAKVRHEILTGEHI
jgi:hypothetical protein